jgi:hypothetical protein
VELERAGVDGEQREAVGEHVVLMPNAYVI